MGHKTKEKLQANDKVAHTQKHTLIGLSASGEVIYIIIPDISHLFFGDVDEDL